MLPWDPYADQSEVPAPYRYEGNCSDDLTGRAGSPLSALYSSGDDSDLDLGRMFGRLGRPFHNLARLYREDGEEPPAGVRGSSSESSDNTKSIGDVRRNGAVRRGGQLLVPPESWV